MNSAVSEIKSPGVDALLFRLGAHRFAVELHQVSSVLTGTEAQGMARLDPRLHLDIYALNGDENHGLEQEELSLRAGLLNQSGPPTVLVLGQVLGARVLRPQDLIELPPWLSAYLPSILYPRCLWTGQNIVWLLNLDTLRDVSRLSP